MNILKPAELIGHAHGLTGWLPGFPPNACSRTRKTDLEVCESLACESCGTVGLECRPFHRPPTGYRVLAVCPECGSVTEV